MVYCSGLENQAGKTPETAEMADSCGLERAPDAMFAACSADGDGTEVGTPDHLYFVEDETAKAIKIGRGRNIRARVSTLQTGNPNPIRLIGSVDGQGWQEPFWHCAWQLQHRRGEWFDDGPELRAAIRAIRHGEEWTPHVYPLVILEDGEVPCEHEWRDHLAVAFADYEDEALGERLTTRAAYRCANSIVFSWHPFTLGSDAP